MEVAEASVDLKASFVHFVYPFLFEAEAFAERIAAITQAQWQGRERPLTVWQTDRFPEDELLSHVARYLNPPTDIPPTAQLWELRAEALTSPAGLGSHADWRLMFPQGRVPFALEAVRLALFRVGVGLLQYAPDRRPHSSRTGLISCTTSASCAASAVSQWKHSERSGSIDRPASASSARSFPSPRVALPSTLTAAAPLAKCSKLSCRREPRHMRLPPGGMRYSYPAS